MLFEITFAADGDFLGDRSVLRSNADSVFGFLRFASKRKFGAEDIGGHLDRIRVFSLILYGGPELEEQRRD